MPGRGWRDRVLAPASFVLLSRAARKIAPERSSPERSRPDNRLPVKSAGAAAVALRQHGLDLCAGHFGRDHVGRRQVDVAHHVLRRRRHGDKTEAERCGSDRAFHRQLRRRRILARDPSAAYEASRSVRSPLIRRAMSALIAAISASPRALRGVRIGSSARIRAGRGDSRNRRSPSRTASSRLWVTSSVVTDRPSTSVAIWSRRRAASASSSDARGSSRMRKSGSIANARASATRRARPSDSSPGKWLRCAVQFQNGEQLGKLRVIGHAARQAAHFLRPIARAAAAAPETPCRSARRPDATT